MFAAMVIICSLYSASMCDVLNSDEAAYTTQEECRFESTEFIEKHADDIKDHFRGPYTVNIWCHEVTDPKKKGA